MLNMNRTVLIVEDQKELQNYLRQLLPNNGYIVEIFDNKLSALSSLGVLQPDLVILDLEASKTSNEEVCAEIKKRYPTLPVIVLTAKKGVLDVVMDVGNAADDYITKPFNSEELIDRINTRLRSQGLEYSKIVVGGLELDPTKDEVKRDNKVIKLTPLEFKLLHYLMSNKGRVLTRDMILNKVWFYSSDVETRVVDVYVGYLRKKLDSGFAKKLISSVRGFGYTIRED